MLLVTFDLLYNNFKITTALLLYFGDKDLEKVQQIVTFTKIANFAKQTVRAKVNLTLMAKKR